MNTQITFDITATITGNQMLDITLALGNQARYEVGCAVRKFHAARKYTNSLIAAGAGDAEIAAAKKSEAWAKIMIANIKTKWRNIIAALNMPPVVM